MRYTFSGCARLSPSDASYVRFVANVHQRVLLGPLRVPATPCWWESGWRHPCLSVRGLAATGRCVSATPSSNAQPGEIPDRFLIVSGRGVNHGTDLVHGVDGQTSETCVFADGLGVIGDVDAEDLVVGDVALLPLHPR